MTRIYQNLHENSCKFWLYCCHLLKKLSWNRWNLACKWIYSVVHAGDFVLFHAAVGFLFWCRQFLANFHLLLYCCFIIIAGFAKIVGVERYLLSFQVASILINCAGIFTPVPLAEITEQIFDTVLEVNLKVGIKVMLLYQYIALAFVCHCIYRPTDLHARLFTGYVPHGTGISKMYYWQKMQPRSYREYVKYRWKGS